MKYNNLSVLILIIASCNSFQSREQRIKDQLESNIELDIIKGCNDIKGIEDTIFVPSILKKPYDGRICHDLRYKGISVYEVKMAALQRISGQIPPNKVTYMLNSENVAFY